MQNSVAIGAQLSRFNCCMDGLRLANLDMEHRKMVGYHCRPRGVVRMYAFGPELRNRAISSPFRVFKLEGDLLEGSPVEGLMPSVPAITEDCFACLNRKKIDRYSSPRGQEYG
jgi:hypothetical protein